ncbi:DUF6531 domain-containing protein [Aquincola sp. MAHUQ-54]|uniref:DUF6531 domain-containing protein n=1 Tax=Aquincola agrisoli TaxID=3119538 RepID=A0AAW9QHS1_9BURK
MRWLVWMRHWLVALAAASLAQLAGAWPTTVLEQPPSAPDACALLPVAALCPGSGPAVLGAMPGTQAMLGDAVNLVDGSLRWRETDLPALPGVLGLEIVRHYRSDAAGRVGAPAVEDALGRGWRLSYDTRWRRGPAGLEIEQADGRVLVFQREASRPRRWRAAQAEFGEVVLHPTPRGDEPVWHWPNGRQLRFAAGGWLEQILAPGGGFVRLQHDRDGRLVAVTDPQGRSLQLRYEATGEDARGVPVVRHIDSPVGRFSFEYQPVAGDVRLLAKASWPTQYDAARRPHAFANRVESLSAAARLYHHEDRAHPARLTGVSHQAQQGKGQWTSQRLQRWAFDAQGRVSHMETTLPAQQGRWALRWSAPPEGDVRGVAVEGGWHGEAAPAERWTSRHEAGAWRVVERLQGRADAERRLWRYGPAGELVGERRQRGGRELDIAATRDALGRLRQVRLVTRAPPIWPQTASRAQVADLAFDGSSARPARLAWTSTVAGRRAEIALHYGPAGQPVRLDMAGFSPVDGEPLRQGWRWRYDTQQGSDVLAGWSIAAPGALLHEHVLEHDLQGHRVTAIVALPGGDGRWELQADAVGRVAGWVDPAGVQTAVDLSPRGEWLALRRAGLPVPIDPPALRPPPAIAGPADELLAIAGRMACDLAATDCDDFGRPVRDAQGTRAFDAAGRLAWSRQADGSETRYRRDRLGRAVRVDHRSPGREPTVEHFLYDGARRIAHARVAGGRIEAEGVRLDAAGRPWVQASLRQGLAVPLTRAWRYHPQGGVSHTYLPDGLAVLHAPAAEAGLPWPAVSVRHPDGSTEAFPLRPGQVWRCDAACDDLPLFDLDAQGRVAAHRVRLDARHWFRLETAHAGAGAVDASGAWSAVRSADGWVRAGAWLKSWWQSPEVTGAGGAAPPLAWRVAPWR